MTAPDRFFVREIITMQDGMVYEMQVGNPLLSDPAKCWLECVSLTAPPSVVATMPGAQALIAAAHQMALAVIADLPTPRCEEIMEGHEEAYRAVEAINPAAIVAKLKETNHE